MPNYKLTYFDFDGGRGEPLRIAFHAAGIAFEDDRLTFPQFGERRAGFPFHCVPVLQVDDQHITQSNAIARYLGKQAGLYPQDALQALYCDEVMDAVEDVTHHTTRTFGLKDEALQQARKKLVEGPLTTYLQGLARLLQRGGGQYFADGKLTVADLKVFVWIRALRGGNLDHVPTDLVTSLAPALGEHADRVAEDPRVVAYYAR